ncbi:MAG: hypothetical protein ACJ71K_10205 [Nitrososphaeraceae archaeon]
MTMDVTEKLAQFLREGQNWEKKSTNVQGVFLLKLPTFKKSPPSIAIEINPINATTGSTTKKKGIIIRSGSELEQISQLLSNAKVVELAKKIEGVNPKEDKSPRSSDTDIFEI